MSDPGLQPKPGESAVVRLQPVPRREEWTSLRAELYQIIQARYRILALVIPAIALIVSIAYNNPTSPAARHLPALALGLLGPSTFMTLVMTEHFVRLTSYLEVSFERNKREFRFESALARYKEYEPHYMAYSIPLAITYFALAVIIVLFYLALWFPKTQAECWSFEQPIFEILLLLVLIGTMARRTAKAGARRDQVKLRWQAAIDDVYRAVFVDRDGVINENRDDHVKSLDQFVFLPRAKEALALLKQEGIRVVVVSNQPIVKGGLASEETVDRINAHMVDQIERAGGRLAAVYYCPHAETDETCDCRKPKTGMFVRAQRELGIELSHSFTVGDQMADIEAGKDIGSYTILVRTGLGKKTESEKSSWKIAPDYIAEDLLEAAKHIVEKLDRQPTAFLHSIVNRIRKCWHDFVRRRDEDHHPSYR